jgi:hypothetical protein
MLDNKYENVYSIKMAFSFDLTDYELTCLERCGITPGVSIFAPDLFDKLERRDSFAYRVMERQVKRKHSTGFLTIQRVRQVRGHVIVIDLTVNPLTPMCIRHVEDILTGLKQSVHLPSFEYIYWKSLKNRINKPTLHEVQRETNFISE